MEKKDTTYHGPDIQKYKLKTSKKKGFTGKKLISLDETGVEPMTFCLQGKRATNCATRPKIKFEKMLVAYVKLGADISGQII